MLNTDGEPNLDSSVHMEPNILSLPVEVLSQIFEFIPTPDLVKNIRLVCKCFLKILDEVFFRRRLKRYFKSTGLPPVISLLGLNENCVWKPGSPVTWKNMCYHFQLEAEIWEKMVNYENFTPKIVHTISKHSASVDTIKLLNKGTMAVSGARDRCLHLWNVENVPYSVCSEERHHGGWIWDIESVDIDKFVSCDWNGDVFLWSLTGELSPILKFSLGSPALSVAAVPEFVVVGLQSKALCFLDPRVGMVSAPVFKKLHRSAVMDVSIEGNYIVSVSEDKTLAVTDIRKLQKVKSFTISDQSIPVSLSKYNNVLYVAETSGAIKVVDSNADFEVAVTLQNSHCRLTSISAGPGTIITASRDCFLTISTPSNPMITRADIHLGAEVACVDYSHHILAVARSDNAVSFFNTTSFH